MGVHVFARSSESLVYVWRPYTSDMRFPAGGWSDRGFIVNLRRRTVWAIRWFESIISHDPYCLQDISMESNPCPGIEDPAWMSLVTRRLVSLALLYRPRKATRAKHRGDHKHRGIAMAQKVQHRMARSLAPIPEGPAVMGRWRSMSTIKVGRYGKYLAKQKLARLGLDVFPDAVPDHDADIVVRSRDGRKCFDIQVRTLRRWGNYFFIPEDEFPQKDNAYLVLVVLPEESEPKYCLLPQSAWDEGHPKYLVHYHYVGRKSKPEYGVRMSENIMEELLRDYRMDSVAALLR